MIELQKKYNEMAAQADEKLKHKLKNRYDTRAAALFENMAVTGTKTLEGITAITDSAKLMGSDAGTAITGGNTQPVSEGNDGRKSSFSIESFLFGVSSKNDPHRRRNSGSGGGDLALAYEEEMKKIELISEQHHREAAAKRVVEQMQKAVKLGRLSRQTSGSNTSGGENRSARGLSIESQGSLSPPSPITLPITTSNNTTNIGVTNPMHTTTNTTISSPPLTPSSPFANLQQPTSTTTSNSSGGSKGNSGEKDKVDRRDSLRDSLTINRRPSFTNSSPSGIAAAASVSSPTPPLSPNAISGSSSPSAASRLFPSATNVPMMASLDEHTDVFTEDGDHSPGVAGTTTSVPFATGAVIHDSSIDDLEALERAHHEAHGNEDYYRDSRYNPVTSNSVPTTSSSGYTSLLESDPTIRQWIQSAEVDFAKEEMERDQSAREQQQAAYLSTHHPSYWDENSFLTGTNTSSSIGGITASSMKKRNSKSNFSIGGDSSHGGSVYGGTTGSMEGGVVGAAVGAVGGVVGGAASSLLSTLYNTVTGSNTSTVGPMGNSSTHSTISAASMSSAASHGMSHSHLPSEEARRASRLSSLAQSIMRQTPHAAHASTSHTSKPPHPGHIGRQRSGHNNKPNGSTIRRDGYTGLIDDDEGTVGMVEEDDEEDVGEGHDDEDDYELVHHDDANTLSHSLSHSQSPKHSNTSSLGVSVGEGVDIEKSPLPSSGTSPAPSNTSLSPGLPPTGQPQRRRSSHNVIIPPSMPSNVHSYPPPSRAGSVLVETVHEDESVENPMHASLQHVPIPSMSYYPSEPTQYPVRRFSNTSAVNGNHNNVNTNNNANHPFAANERKQMTSTTSTGGVSSVLPVDLLTPEQLSAVAQLSIEKAKLVSRQGWLQTKIAGR